MIGQQLGRNLDVVGWLLREPVGYTIIFIVGITGNG